MTWAMMPEPIATSASYSGQAVSGSAAAAAAAASEVVVVLLLASEEGLVLLVRF
jgi:hypothetical protein